MPARALFKAPEPQDSNWFIPFAEAIEAMLGRRVVLPGEFYDVLQDEARAKAFSVTGISSIDQLQAVLDSLGRAMSEGMAFSEWKKLVTSGDIALDLPAYRVENIYRTNVQTAYAAGRWKQMETNKENRPWLMYDAIDDSRTRPAHRELDAHIARIDDPFWNSYFPPLGFQCRCSTIALDDDEAIEMGGPSTDIPNVKPDSGWGFNPGKSRWAGIEQSFEKRETTVDQELQGKLIQFRPPKV